MTGTARLFLPLLTAAILGNTAPAHAEDVTPKLVSTVQNAIRWGVPRWTPEQAAEAAGAFNKTAEPRRMLAIAVLESDLRPAAFAWVRYHGRVGSATPRRRAGRSGEHHPKKLHPGHWRARAWSWATSAGATPRAGDVVDAGLMGIRCVFGADRRCKNGPARGHTLAELLDPVTSIQIADAIMAQKVRVLGRKRATAGYNGDLDGRNGYAGKVGAVMRSSRGKKTKTGKGRVSGLIRQIVEAIEKERKS